MSVGLIAAIAALVVGLFLIVHYNRLVRGRNGWTTRSPPSTSS